MSALNIRELDIKEAGFKKALETLLDRKAGTPGDVETTVRIIIEQVRDQGDAALLEYTKKFDELEVDAVSALEISVDRLNAARDKLTREECEAVEQAAERIRRFHEHQREDSWSYTEDDGTRLGQKVTALDRVGIYVPGGKAAYPSSVLMNAIPAKVAGVGELIMTVPAPRGEISDMVLAAAAIAGVDRVFTLGGAQAVAALAYGTETIPKVDKIVGPGNVYVATAKRLVFGEVDIDMIAGPSEIVIVCDGDTDPEWVAMDLFSQAEHDETAQAILISLDAGFTMQVKAAMMRLIDEMPRRDIIRSALERRGALITVTSETDATELVNTIAPEHLELSVADPDAWVAGIRHAGAIFLGRYAAEVLGDYCAGPNHVLPTSGTARFSSPLGVYDFQKRSNLIYCTADGAKALGQVASILAHSEGLVAHARAAEYRIKER